MSSPPGPPILRVRAAGARVAISSLLARAVRAGCRPASPASAAAFRIVFGLLGVAAVVRFAANGWISELYTEPAHHLSYYGFGWVQAWPGWGMHIHFALLGLASLGVALGYRYRLSITAFFLLFTYVELIDQTTYLNHYYLVSLMSFIMVFLPLGRAVSLDSRGPPVGGPRPAIPSATLWMLRAQIGLVYVFAGVAKLNPDWMLDAEPLRIWLYNATGTPVLAPFLREAWVPYAMSWAGTLFDLTIVGWLLWRRTRLPAYAMLVLFHVSTWLLFPSIGMFPWIMIGAALIFFEPDWPSRVVTGLRGQSGASAMSTVIPAPPARARSLSWPVRAAFALGVVFLAVQVLVPLRHVAYPGNVRWTEEGYRFSWRVLVTEKTGLVRFRVTSLATERERLVYPEAYLTPVQVERMSYQPDMILATAHIIRDDFINRGHERVEVRVDAYVTYNGRPAARLIDPDVDLARIDAGIGPKHWIVGYDRERWLRVSDPAPPGPSLRSRET